MKNPLNKVKALFGLLRTEPVTSREAAIQVANQVAVIQLKRDTLTLQMDAELQAVKDRFSKEIEQLNAQEQHEVKRLKSWAVTHRAAEFDGHQELILAGHSFAFRRGTGSVELSGKEDEILDALLGADGDEADELKQKLVRVKPSLNKDAILREWRMNNRQVPEAIAAFGIGVAVDETFTFTPARVELPESAQTSAVESEAA